MKNDDLTPADIDNIISAELPEDPEDRWLVVKYMMHSHPRNGEIPPYCKKRNGDNVCRFEYPKPVIGTMYIDATGRTHYR
jgi:hypothetical protein